MLSSTGSNQVTKLQIIPTIKLRALERSVNSPWLSASDSVDLWCATFDKLFLFDGECLRAANIEECN